MRHHRREKRNRVGLLALALLAFVFAVIAFLVASPPMPSHSGVQSAEDAFYGTITNVSFKGSIHGVVEADTNCKPVENGLTNCIAIIDASDGTELHFNYSHDMSKQSCLALGDHVTLSLLSNETVKIVRA